MVEGDKSRTGNPQILFKVQGITLSAIATAVGLLISTTVMAVTGDSGAGTVPSGSGAKAS